MKNRTVSEEVKNILIIAQRAEITEHLVYLKLSRVIKDEKNREILRQIGEDEKRHYGLLKKYTGMDVRPVRWKVAKYYWISRLLGITFGLKLMERGEQHAQSLYRNVAESVAEIHKIEQEEEVHEKKLLDMIDEEKLRYAGSVVLGLNDALVELTGALAGFTFALQDTSKIAFAGFITGIAASFSMAASEYLSTRTEEGDQNAIKASIYTGTAYVVTVVLLIIPYIIFTNYYICLMVTLLNAIIIILVFNYYISIARDLSFKKRFLEMVLISLGVAALTFSIGFLIRISIGMDV